MQCLKRYFLLLMKFFQSSNILFEFFFFKIRDLMKMDRGVQPYSELASFKVHRMSGCFAKTQTG